MENIVVKMWNEQKGLLHKHFKDNVPEEVDKSKYRLFWTDMIDLVADEVIEYIVNRATSGPTLQKIEFSTSTPVEYKNRSDESAYELNRFFFDEYLSVWVLQVRFHPCEYSSLTIDGFVEPEEAVSILMNLAIQIVMGIRKVGEEMPYTRSVLFAKDRCYELEYLYELSSCQTLQESCPIDFPTYLRDLGWDNVLPILKGVPSKELKELKLLYDDALDVLYGKAFEKLREKSVEDGGRLEEFRRKLRNEIDWQFLQLLYSALGDGYIAIGTFLLEIRDETSKYFSYPDRQVFYGRTLDELFAKIQQC